MKRTLPVLALLLALSISGLISAQAHNIQEKGYISVNTNADTEVAPDTAEIAFAVKTYDTKSIQKASQDNKVISDKLYSILSGMLTVENGDYIKTANFNATPLYTYNGGKRNFDKYEVSNKVVIHTKNIDKIGEMIDKAIDAGATNVDSLIFSVSNYDAQCNNLIQTGSKKATERASIIAKSTSSVLDGIKSFDVNCSANNYNTPRMFLAKNMLSAAADEATGGVSTSVSGGVIKINANINAQFFVK